ncbi:MAG: sulfite exporter TauE/SafE family protein [Pseudomonadota bacterium]
MSLGAGELALLFGAVVLAGLVRGFSGFGTALVYVPLASLVLPPVSVLVTMIVFDAFGPLPLLRRAWRAARPDELWRLVLGAAIGVQIGLWLLTRADPVAFRWAVAVIALLLVGLLMSGWRFSGRLPGAGLLGVGGLSGTLGGFGGLSGPPVILFYLGGPGEAATVRANILLFLVAGNLLSAASFGARGLLGAEALLLGLLLALPYTLATLAGQQLFGRASERTFRGVAYALIAGVAVLSLPLWGS